MISSILTGIGEGLGDLLPLLAEGIVDGFEKLFLVVGNDSTYTLNALGQFAVAMIAFRLATKYIPMIVAFFRLKGKNAGGSKRGKKARA